MMGIQDGTATTLVRFSSIGLLALALAVAAGCGSVPGEGAGVPQVEAAAAPTGLPASGDHSHHAQMSGGEHTDYSIYHLDSVWWDQHGESRELGSLAGRVQVVAMVYTHCAYACPKILMDMKRIEGRIAETHPDGPGFVLVSIDPERDDPARLGYFAEATRLDPARWTLLGGSDDSVLELATLLGIKYMRESEIDFSHSNAMLVLNPAGEIVYRHEGLGEDLTPMIAAVRAALNSAGSTAD